MGVNKRCTRENVHLYKFIIAFFCSVFIFGMVRHSDLVKSTIAYI